MIIHAAEPHRHDLAAEGCPERGKHAKALRKRALMEAATAVFAEHGYDAATTRAVAERAACSEGLIHRYFGGKRGLLLALLDEKADRFAEQMRAALPDRATLDEELARIFLWPLESMWEQRAFLRVCVSRAAIDPEVGHVVGLHLNARRVEVIAEKLRRHRAAGHVRDDVDIDAVAYAITGMNLASGFFLQAVFDLDRDEVRQMTEQIARVVARGIAADCAETAAARDGGRKAD
ncbi:MAG: TetR/AcrR family transcriptional regulator [Chloroflexota bacterium]|nr:TetR/AcrR family transcriptional regulator [Chloroflexota bacterium]